MSQYEMQDFIVMYMKMYVLGAKGQYFLTL